MQPMRDATNVPTKSFGTIQSKSSSKADLVEIASLNEKVDAMKENNLVLEKEREFYFNKLQQIEQALKFNDYESSPIGTGLLNIMYAGEEDQVEVLDSGDLNIVQEGKQTVYNLKQPAGPTQAIAETNLLEAQKNYEMPIDDDDQMIQ